VNKIPNDANPKHNEKASTPDKNPSSQPKTSSAYDENTNTQNEWG
jgi:hypothetical protein